MVPYWMGRTELLLGNETVERIMLKHVLIVGLGGVGGICAEMIARAGIGRITIVDNDSIDLSNCNRQIPALHSTAGRPKAEVMAERLLDINPQLQLTVLAEYLKEARIGELLDENSFDYAVDCIDTLGPKTTFMKACYDRKIPIVTSLGAGGKLDPQQVVITDISQTHTCRLAKYVRKYLHQMGITKGIKVVFSPEVVDQSKVIETEKAFPKKSLIGTISYMPAIFGYMVASVVIRDLMEEPGKPGEA